MILQRFLPSKNTFLFITVIVLLAAALRFYRLGDVPHGMTWDEAAIGYNGYALFTTRRDEWLVRLPVSFQSFGDYKAPLAIYLNGFFTKVGGMNLRAMRFPFVLAGVGSVFLIMILVKEIFRAIFPEKKSALLWEKAQFYMVIAGVLLTLSPWHHHFSRAGFESGMSLFFLLLGVWALWSLLQHKKATLLSSLTFLSLSSVGLVASIYTYHSAKMVAPLLVIVLLLLFFKEAWQRRVYLIGEGVLSAVLLWPFIKDTLWSAGGERFTQASLFGLHLTSTELLTQITTHFFQHLTPAFLLFGQTPTLRHGDGHWGVLFLTEFLVLLFGVGFMLWQKLNKKKEVSLSSFEWRVALFSLAWIVIGLLPAAIGRDVPHSNRALLALPGFVLFISMSLSWLLRWLQKLPLNTQVSGSKGEEDLLVKSVLGILIFLHVALSLGYLHDYYTVFARESAEEFKDGYIEAMEYAKKYEKEVDKILFTNAYGQPYIYAIFVRRTNPIWYQGGSLIKFEFSDRINEGDRNRPNTVIVATPKEIPPKPEDQVVLGSDGKARFVLIKTPAQ